MTGGIFVLRDDDELVPLVKTAYDSEDVLQALLAALSICSPAINFPARLHAVGYC